MRLAVTIGEGHLQNINHGVMDLWIDGFQVRQNVAFAEHVFVERHCEADIDELAVKQ